MSARGVFRLRDCRPQRAAMSAAARTVADVIAKNPPAIHCAAMMASCIIGKREFSWTTIPLARAATR